MAHNHAAALQRVEHGETARRGGVLAGAERLAGGYLEIDRALGRFLLGRVNMEAAGADWLGALLAQRHPIGIGQLFDQEFGSFKSDEHKSKLPSLMRFSYAVFCLTKHIIHYTN